MKKTLLIISMITLIFAGCKKFDEIEASKVEIVEEKIEKGWDYIKIDVEYDYPVELEAVTLYLSEKEDMSGAKAYECNVEGKEIIIYITDVKDNTQYYYQFEYDDSYQKIKSEKKDIKTSIVPFVVTTSDVINIKPTSAQCGGNIVKNVSVDIIKRGICWAATSNPTINDNVVNDNYESDSFRLNITGLTDNIRYYVRAYAFSSEDTIYGEEKSFTTVEIVKPTVITNNITNITPTTGTLNGEVTFEGNAIVTAKGFCWDTSPEPTLDDNYSTNGSGIGGFTHALTDLPDNTTYYVRAYATNEKGTAYGKEKSFTTVEVVLPTVITDNITDITTNSAKCSGTVTSDGNSAILAKGVCWSTSPEPTLNNNYTDEGDGSGAFISSLTNLTDGVKYYVRAYATNEKGTAYGEEKSFTTVEVVLPTVVTNDITDITTNSAKCSGAVTSDGNSAILAKGICWSTSPEPTLNNNYTDEGDGSGAFISSLTNLTDGVKYYVRAYAINEKGTAYGEEKSFTTLDAPQSFTVNGVSFTMISVEGGTFQMGATSEQGSDAYSDESPVHSVTLSDYCIGETEVTQELWEAVMGSNPSFFSGYPQRPVEKVSWNDCQEFITKLNELTGENFRLPTEAEWEYAARGGNKSQGYKYSGSNTIGDVSWYTDNSSSRTHDVKTKQANELGIYDMSGNVREWCQDWYGSYSSSSQTNPTGPTSGSSRVLRGGSWSVDARLCRVSRRNYGDPGDRNRSNGFRLILQ